MRITEINKIDQLNSCVKELNSLGPDTETEFLSIGEMLNNLSDTCFGMTDAALQLVDLANFNDEENAAENQSFTNETRAIFKDVALHVEDSVQTLNEGGGLLRELSERIGKLRSPIQTLYSIGKTFRVLGISIKIESSRNESSSQGFKLLAEEVADISLAVQENCRFCIEKANIVERDITSSHQELSNTNKNYDNNADQSIFNILGALEDVGNKSEMLAAGIQERSGEMVQGIGDVVMAMQFHDITRQQLENVAKALDELGDKVKSLSLENKESVMEQDVLELYTVLSIQAAHLNSIYEQIFQARKQIETGLGKTMDQAKIQAGDARTLLDMEGQAGNKSVVAELEKEINNIASSLEKSLGVIQHAAEVSKNVYDNVSEIGDFVSKIEKIAFDVKILAINAMVEATKTGETGRTLIVLAKELSILSQETRGGAAKSIEMLQSIMEGTEKQLEFSSTIDQNRSEVDTMIKRARSLSGIILSAIQEINRLAQKMDSDSRKLASSIVKLIPGIQFPRVMGDRIDRNWQVLCDIINHIEDEFPQFLEKNEKVEQMLKSLSEQYVMDRERSIHAQVAGGQIADESGSDDEIFGSDDIELFSNEASGEAQENDNQLGDNIELF